MEQNKFDEQIKENLDNRRLQPSTDAWEKLSNRLDIGAKKKQNNAFWYIGIAASIIGILFVALPVYQHKAGGAYNSRYATRKTDNAYRKSCR